ncbi:MAG TPA: hypothetical protein VNB23_00735, partial [Ramlibacter sp.]|nr:hypothetical protein [Ramlibacter sp.]
MKIVRPLALVSSLVVAAALSGCADNGRAPTAPQRANAGVARSMGTCTTIGALEQLAGDIF